MAVPYVVVPKNNPGKPAGVSKKLAGVLKILIFAVD